MSTFDVIPIARFAGSSAAIKRPREIACFSYDSEHKFRLDDSSINYYYPPALPADLNAGFETFNNLREDQKGDEHIDSLLKTIMALEKKEGKKCEADFVTWRGMMTKIMAAPFDMFSEFEMYATCYQGTIFIEEDYQWHLDQRAKQLTQKSRRQHSASQELMQYWGYKFETLALIPDIWDNVSREYIESRPSLPVSNKAQYCSVVRTAIGTSSMVIGGEVDALWDSKPSKPSPDPTSTSTFSLQDDPSTDEPINWVELKTAIWPATTGEMLTFERKLLKFWIQSFLLGVPRIIVGFRDRHGILRSLEELQTHSLPGMVKRQHASWDGNTCVNFAAGFLAYLKETVTTPEKYRIRRTKGSPTIEVVKLPSALGDYSHILSAEFVQWREEGGNETSG
ncbi:rai1 protein [Pseudovirgaria hyperparasitica]|uniref:Decapping nuclease n=1 Tax=Pseudovirgaria hyperparasitica TaxID=470096 RepID=A0A6A6W1U4_9PEZI|nr:rai1 protein [Pseudovirgaria hyperparasitica]KAF2755974.1 rai1 protein [Pseudovirgaria hyperparasitica]